MESVFQEKEAELLHALSDENQDYDRAQTLIHSGADVNAHDGGLYLFEYIINDISDNADVLRVAEFLIQNGFDVKTSGIRVMKKMSYGEDRRRLFDLSKLFLSSGMDQLDDEELKDWLSILGTEESYSICCEENSEKTCLYYATYELVDAALKKKDYSETGIWEDAVGLRIEQISALTRAKTIIRQSTDWGTELLRPIYLVCGNKAAVIQDRPAIFLQSWPKAKQGKKAVVLNEVFPDIIGAAIVSIRFACDRLSKRKADYHRPVITLELDNGRRLRFSSNFGEVPRPQSKCNLIIE